MNIKKFALLAYDGTNNLGDEIQSLAARQFIPSVDILVDRESLSHPISPLCEPHNIIMNGWFLHRPEMWPPTNMLNPLITSFHVTGMIYHAMNKLLISPVDRMLERDSISYFRRFEPIGARDTWTRDLFMRSGIKSFFSGCLTLTLTIKGAPPRRDVICVNDLDDESIFFVKKMCRSEVITTSHNDMVTVGFDERCVKAIDLLKIYATSRCVVTSRLHCAIPCLALGTPVLIVWQARDTYRFSGLSSLVRHCNRTMFLDGRADFNFDAPSPNDKHYLIYRENLIKQCLSFVSSTTGVTNPAMTPLQW